MIVHLCPRCASIVRAVETVGELLSSLGARALDRVRKRVGFDYRINNFWIALGHCESDASLHCRRESAALDLGPRCTGVRGLPESAAWAATLEEVRAAHALPARSVERVGIGWVHRDIHKSGLVADEFAELPGSTTVGRLVESALLVRAPRMTERGNIHRIRIGGIYNDASNLLRLAQADERPAASAVGALVHTAAGRYRVTRIFLAGAGIYHVGVRGRYRKLAHCADWLMLEHWLERCSGVGRLPNTAGRGRDVERARRGRDSSNAGNTASHVRRADVSPFEASQSRRVERLSRRRTCDRRLGSQRRRKTGGG